MSREVDKRIDELLRDAEARSSCYVPGGEDEGRVRRALSRRVANGTVTSPWRGLFVRTETWDGLKPAERTRLLAHGLQERHPDWVFCGPTAAALYGMDVSDTLLHQVHLACMPAARGAGTPGLRRHPVLVPVADAPGTGTDAPRIEVVDSLRVTSPEQTILDCLRWTDFPRGLGVADSALRQGLVSQRELFGYIDAASGRFRGTDRAVATLSWADPRSENGGESIVRGRMILLGFVCPELQIEVPRVIERGRPWRADYGWVRADGLVILGELDGDGKYVEAQLMGGRSIDEVLSDENVRGSRFTLYDVSLARFRFGQTARPAAFAALLDEYGVPRRGSALALPEGTRMVPDWDALRRNKSVA